MPRTIKNPGIFAGDANTTIPPTPVSGVSYRDAVSGLANIRQGWPFDTIVNSPEFAQILHQLTSLTDLIDRTGLLEYKDDVDYDTVPAYVQGSNGLPYTSQQVNGPATTVVDPVGDTTGVWVLGNSAMATYAAMGGFFTGGGVADAYTLTATVPQAAPPTLVDGMRVRAIFSNNNTGAATLNPFGLGAVNIKLAGGVTDPAAGDIAAGDEATLTYRVAPSAHFELQKRQRSGADVGQLGEFYVLPSGWLKENGDMLLIADYPELYDVIGTMFGGDGVTTFALNDTRGHHRRGWDDGRGIDPGRVLGSTQLGQTNNLANVDQTATDYGVISVTVPEDGTYSAWQGGPNTNGQRFRNRGVETRVINTAVINAIKY